MSSTPQSNSRQRSSSPSTPTSRPYTPPPNNHRPSSHPARTATPLRRSFIPQSNSHQQSSYPANTATYPYMPAPTAKPAFNGQQSTAGAGPSNQSWSETYTDSASYYSQPSSGYPPAQNVVLPPQGQIVDAGAGRRPSAEQWLDMVRKLSTIIEQLQNEILMHETAAQLGPSQESTDKWYALALSQARLVQQLQEKILTYKTAAQAHAPPLGPSQPTYSNQSNKASSSKTSTPAHAPPLGPSQPTYYTQSNAASSSKTPTPAHAPPLGPSQPTYYNQSNKASSSKTPTEDPARLKCPYCESDYKTQETRKVHIASEHENTVYPCAYGCKLVYRHTASASRHNKVCPRRNGAQCGK